MATRLGAEFATLMRLFAALISRIRSDQVCIYTVRGVKVSGAVYYHHKLTISEHGFDFELTLLKAIA